MPRNNISATLGRKARVNSILLCAAFAVPVYLVARPHPGADELVWAHAAYKIPKATRTYRAEHLECSAPD